MTSAKEKQIRIFFLLGTFTRKNNWIICFSSCHFHKEKKNILLNTFYYLFGTFTKEKKCFEDNLYKNIYELINMNISADGNPIPLV